MSNALVVRSPSKRAKAGAAAVALLLASGVAAGTLAPRSGDAASHREAPLIAGDPRVDNTDVYAFVSPDAPSKVTIVTNFQPFEEPAGGPNFYPNAIGAPYDVKIDNDGDARPDIIYRWWFKNHIRNEETFLYNTGPVTSLDDPDLNLFQTYDLWKIVRGKSKRKVVDGAVAVPSRVGDASMPDYAALRSEGVVRFAGGSSKTFAGQADDPFFLDLRVFDLLYGGNFSEVGDDTLAGFNVNTLALQVPKEDLARGGRPGRNPVVGVWSSAARRPTRPVLGGSRSAPRVQVSRLAMPLVNEVIIPLEDKDLWNMTRPAKDAPQFVKYYRDPVLARTVNAVYGIPIPDTRPEQDGVQRDDLIQVFLTGVPGLNKPEGQVVRSDELRLNMSIAPCESGSCDDYSPLGVIGGDVAGFPNGRRLADDVLDVALQVMEGELAGSPNDLADGVDANDRAFTPRFPYVALPHSGSDATVHQP